MFTVINHSIILVSSFKTFDERKKNCDVLTIFSNHKKAMKNTL